MGRLRAKFIFLVEFPIHLLLRYPLAIHEGLR